MPDKTAAHKSDKTHASPGWLQEHKTGQKGIQRAWKRAGQKTDLHTFNTSAKKFGVELHYNAYSRPI